MKLPSFGKLPSGDRLQRISRSPHFRGGSFVNIHPTKKLADDASYLSMMTKFFSNGVVNRIPAKKIPVVETNLKTLSLEKDQLVWFGHSSYFMIINGKRILVDPMFSQRASPFQFMGMKRYEGTFEYTTADFPSLDYIIITHDHYDHLDYNSIKDLKDRTGHFVTALGVGAHLEAWGVEPKKITELDWWESTTLDGNISLTATPARHFSGRGIRGNKTLWASFVLSTDRQRIFIGGDSGYDDSFQLIGQKYGPFSLAMLECGQYDKQWPSIHMMPEQVAQAAVDLKTKFLLPVHWAKFSLALHSWTDPIERLTKKASAIHVSVITPKVGQQVLLDEIGPGTPWWRD